MLSTLLILVVCRTRVTYEFSKWPGQSPAGRSLVRIPSGTRIFSPYHACDTINISPSSNLTIFHYLSQLVSTSCYTCRAPRYFWHNRFDCNFQTRLVDQSPEDVNRETTAPLPIRALGTRRPCLELKNAPLRRRAASGDPEVPREATSPPHLTCPHSLIRNNSSLEENQVRRGFGCGGKGVGCE